MSAEVLAHVFEPFFTTKEIGRGTGLGLATVYGIITQNGGFITATSEPRQGSTFRIYLPRCLEVPADPDGVPARLTVVGGTETILVVEDETRILDLVAHLLTTHGYRVLAAHGAGEALRAAQQHKGLISLLVTDVVMPEMDGEKLRIALTELRPGLKCLYMSGYTANVIAHHGILQEGVNFIEKPFTLETFVAKVRQVLDSA
jgi:CheY-like chemotaxis protein